MKTIAILNHKGGVGKTTTTASLAAALVKFGQRVLTIDLDGQANLSHSLGCYSEDKNIYTALKEGGTLPIYKNVDGIDIVPAVIDLQAAEMELASEPGRELLLKDLLHKHSQEYDYVLIDCPPSLGLLTLNALTASTDIIIPVESEPLSLKGMNTLMGIIEKVQHRLNKNLRVMGVLITKYDSRKNLNKEVLEVVKEHYPEWVFNTVIRDNIKLAEASSSKRDILHYDQKSNGAMDYIALAEEIIKK